MDRLLSPPRCGPVHSLGVAADGDGGAAGAAERGPGSLLPGDDVPEEHAHLGDLVLVRLVHLGLVVVLLLDPPHLAVHHLPFVSHLLLPLHCQLFLE
jgi:hypothetical protein